MPFLISKKVIDKISPLAECQKIKLDDLINYRNQFIDRHERLRRSSGLDYSADLREIAINTEFFCALLLNSMEGHYFVAQYYCSDQSNGFKDLAIALCVKRKLIDSEQDDEVIGNTFYDISGKPITAKNFAPLAENYRNRRDSLEGAPGNEFKNDREGRAHKITANMKLIVQEILDTNKHVFAYFILDDHLAGKTTLSVVFADEQIKFDKALLDDPGAYDHGTACCPIG